MIRSNETPKPGRPCIRQHRLSRSPRSPPTRWPPRSGKSARAGYEPRAARRPLEGEARDVAASTPRLARDLQAQGKRAVILSGGELTVTIRGNGRGGPNQEYALALAVALDGTQSIAAIAGDTDGTDGGGGSAYDPAGAYADFGTAERRANTRPRSCRVPCRQQFDRILPRSLATFWRPGPTFTNVNDFRAIVVDRAKLSAGPRRIAASHRDLHPIIRPCSRRSRGGGLLIG